MPRDDLRISQSLALRILDALPEEALPTIGRELRGGESEQLATIASQLHVVRRIRDRAKSDPERARGLYDKYVVHRLDGSTEAGRKHERCRHFVLDLDHDPIAPICLKLYADLCESTYPQLARDLRRLADSNGL